MTKEKPHCLNCKHVRHSIPDENGKQDSFCKLLDTLLPRMDVIEKVDCNKFKRSPHTCASCGAEIVGGKKVSNPLRYKKGKNKGKVKPCCDNPDWRVCPDKWCEGDAVVCKNCGYYFGMMTW